jgi:cell division inhibitor SepF
MGFGRKVGAFLGLVPEDGQPQGRYSDQYAADDDFEGAEYTGEFGPDYGADYQPHEYSGARSGGHQAAESYPEPAYASDRGGDKYSADKYSGDRYSARVSAGSSPAAGFAAEPVTQGALAMQPVPQPRRETESKVGSRPVTVKLTGFAEARVIGEKYRDGQAVIMDMTEMNDSDARRLVDFAAGLAFAKRGSIDKVTTKVFMLLPSDIDPADFSPEQRREYAGAYSR